MTASLREEWALLAFGTLAYLIGLAAGWGA